MPRTPQLKCDLDHVAKDSLWRNLLDAWLGFLYPPHCLLCKTPLEQKPGLCQACATVTGCTSEEIGIHCVLDGVDVVVLKEFNDSLREMIHMLKYQGKILPGRLFGRALGHCVRSHLDLGEDWVVMPIPLHAARMRERGYNQSALVARALAGVLGLSVLEKVVVRVRHTSSQTRLNKEKRHQNVAGAFSVKSVAPLVGQQVVLVDDVVTTGATACTCAEALLDAGAKRVVVAAISRPEIGKDHVQEASVVL